MPSAAPRVSATPGGPAAAPVPAGHDAPTGRAAGTLLALILTGQFMATLDVSIVNVAARTIQRDLHASGPALQVIVAGYTVVYAVLLISSARLGGRHGYRRLFLTGTALFTAASLACGLAPGAGWLIGFRLGQGAGAALLVPQVMSLIQHSLTGPSRVRALGVYTAVLAAGAVVGQILGGVLVGADLFGSGWRAVFLVNVPVGVVLLAAGRRLLPAVEGTRARRLDLPGLLLLAAALGLLVTPLVLGHETGWPAWTWVLLAASAAAFAAFVRFERRLTARGGDPLIEGRVLRSPGLVPAAAAICLVLVTFSGFLFVCALHFQGALRYGPEHAGLLFVPLVVTFGLGGLYWRRLPARLHPALPVAGLLAAALGYGALALLQRGGGQAGVAVETALAVVGLSSGIAYGPLFGLALGRVGAADAADASGLMNTVIQLGQVLGVSVIGTLFLSRVALPAAGAASGHALAVATWVVAAVAVLAAACAHLARRSDLHPDVNPQGAAARRRNEGSPTSPPGTPAGQRTQKVEHMQDEQRVMEFLERVVADQAAAFAGVSTSLGIRLGLYRAMSGAGALTCAELAKSTGVAERYVREWLAAQVAGAYVLHDAEADTYVLPDAHAAVLADSSLPTYVGSGFTMLKALYGAEEALERAYRTGGGVGWQEYGPELAQGVAAFFRPGYAAVLVQEWLPAMEGVEAKLRQGASVADVGCGFGHSTVLMAQAYPRSRFHGFDFHADSVAAARRLAEEAGVADRVTFEVAAADGFPGDGYDLVTFFDCLHDLGDPGAALRQAEKALAADGSCLVVEPNASAEPRANIHPIGRSFAATSAVLCLPTALAQNGPHALGNHPGRALEGIAAEAGLSRWRLAVETPTNRVHDVKR